VKVLGPAHSPEAVDRHLHLLASLGGATHPALARVVEGGVARLQGAPMRWIATRWVEGRSARESIEAGGLDAAAALRALKTLASGLAHLHGRGVVHRDLSPGNVILTPAGDAVLIDFGQAFLADSGAAPSRGVVGTPGYVAPEEVREGGGAVSPAADCYGLAAIGYALATGAAPAQGRDVLDVLARAAAAPPSPRDLGVVLPEALEAAILQGLEPRPQARPTAGAFGKALEFSETTIGLGGVGP
jgi:serine/threonine-protein kinase